jgi:hypothetical protein
LALGSATLVKMTMMSERVVGRAVVELYITEPDGKSADVTGRET